VRPWWSRRLGSSPRWFAERRRLLWGSRGRTPLWVELRYHMMELLNIWGLILCSGWGSRHVVRDAAPAWRLLLCVWDPDEAAVWAPRLAGRGWRDSAGGAEDVERHTPRWEVCANYGVQDICQLCPFRYVLASHSSGRVSGRDALCAARVCVCVCVSVWQMHAWKT